MQYYAIIQLVNVDVNAAMGEPASADCVTAIAAADLGRLRGAV